ncbi:MAG: efflux transporter outer membrane subunit [Caulobacteraceae bacterium]|nr:efflux transporter outer membrane subunit [Caulobacteraceae bacterium]
MAYALRLTGLRTRRLVRPALAAVAAMLVSGCLSFDPHYTRPASPVPAELPQGGAYPPAGPDAAAAADLPWRAFFTDAKLQGVVAEALADNRDLRVAVLNVAEARAQRDIQRAALFPHLNAEGQGTYESEPAALLGATSGAGAAAARDKGSITFRYFTAGLAAPNYELDLWGRVRSLSRAALEQYLASDSARRAAQISLIAEVADQYVAYAADLARLDAARQTAASDGKILDLTRARFQAGVASELDVRQAETALDQARADVATYTTILAQDLNALTLLVGGPVAADALPGPLGDGVFTLADLPVGVSSAVLLNRPDVEEAEHQLKAYNADVGAARAAFFPQITLTGQDGAASLSLGRLFTPGSGAWSFSPTITLPIFAGGANAANLHHADAERQAAVAQYEKAVQSAFRDVADALAQRGQVGELLDAQQALVQAADRSLVLSRARYERGSDTYLNTLTAEVSLYSAREALIAARQTRQTNLVALYSALGGGVK